MRGIRHTLIALATVVLVGGRPLPWPTDELEARDMAADWAFGRVVPLSTVTHDASESAAKLLSEMDRLAGLTDDQRSKLKLAARADILYFSADFEMLRSDLKEGRLDKRDRWRFDRLRYRLEKGLFGSDSLFQKTALTTLDAEQAERLELYFRKPLERARDRRRRFVCSVILERMDLTKQDAQQLNRFILDRTQSFTPERLSIGPDNGRFVRSLKRIPLESWKAVIPRENWAELPEFPDDLWRTCEEE